MSTWNQGDVAVPFALGLALPPATPGGVDQHTGAVLAQTAVAKVVDV